MMQGWGKLRIFDEAILLKSTCKAPFTLMPLDWAKHGSLFSMYQMMSVNGLIWARKDDLSDG